MGRGGRVLGGVAGGVGGVGGRGKGRVSSPTGLGDPFPNAFDRPGNNSTENGSQEIVVQLSPRIPNGAQGG